MSRLDRRPVLAAAAILLVGACAAPSSPTPPPAAQASSNSVVSPESVTPEPGGPSAQASPVASTGGATIPVPSCTAPATPTTAQTEGPYYIPGAPERADLTTDGMPGTRLTIAGLVATTDCAPVAGAKVDAWQADAGGAYDNAGYTLRGYVTTDTQGRFTLRTVVPGEYPGRTEHIHVKVTPPGGTTLTTQLYFPGATANEGDNIFSPDLLLDIAEQGDELVGDFTFVLVGP